MKLRNIKFNLAWFLDALSRRQLLNWMPSSTYLKLRFYARTGYDLDLKQPVTFNQKLQWLKLNDHNPKYTQMVDKHAVKDYVASKIGIQYVIPNVGGPWKCFDDIDFSLLPEQFVLKCTHDSGGTVVCSNKSNFDKSAARSKIEKSLSHNYYWQGREWPYKNVTPQIIAEKYVGNPDGTPPIDYKLMCFGGEVKCTFTVTNRFSDTDIFVNFYDVNWRPMPFERHYKRNPSETPMPKTYLLMVDLAQKLSEDIPFVRVDFYEVEGNVYFGEMTFFPGGGMEEFTPFFWDKNLGDWIDLPET